MYMRVWVKKGQTVVLPVLPYFCWLHLLHKQLNNEVESPSIYGVGRTGLSAHEGGSIQHTPHLAALPELEGKRLSSRAVFLADLQVAAWPSCERPAQFLESPVAAVGLRTVLRALSALGMMDGAAHSLYPEVIESAVFWRLQRGFLSLSLWWDCSIWDIIFLQRHPRNLCCI